MGARVDLHLKRPGGAHLATAALLNGGFEADAPHVLLPRRAYTHLFPDAPSGAHPDSVQTAGGASPVLVLPDPVEACVDAGDRMGPVAVVHVIVSEFESEVLVSDTAIDALGLEIKSHGRGLWRFVGEERVRPSVPPQLW
ncbi:MAG TPA: hypothetical protein VGJ84_07765 [Polyangiaceae bacterium]